MSNNKLQNQDFKTEAELVSLSATKADLLNDTKVYITAQGINKRLDEAIIAGDIGGGTGINEISNYRFEDSTTGWVAYNNGNVAIPTTGTSGSPSNFTFTRNTTTPLRGVADGKIAITGANTKGNGVSYDFTTKGAVGSPVFYELNLDYNFATIGVLSLGFFVYDVTGSSLTRANFGEMVTSLAGRHKAMFVLKGGNSYRFIIHQTADQSIATNSFIDNVTFGPMTSSFNSNVGLGTDLETITAPTGTWTNTTYSARVKKEFGEVVMEIKMVLTGAPAGGTLLINIPTGYAPDFNQMMTPTTNAYPAGEGTLNRGATGYKLHMVFNSSTQFLPVYEISSANTAVLTATAPITFQAGDEIIYRLKYPVSGWQTGLTLATVQKNMIPIYVKGAGNAGDVITNSVTPIPFIETQDTTNSWNGTEFVALEGGEFFLEGALKFTADNTREIWLYKNTGGGYVTINRLDLKNGSAYYFDKVVSLNAGDKIQLRTGLNGGTLSNSTQEHFISITKIHNPTDLIFPLSSKYDLIGQATANNTASISFTDIKNFYYESYVLICSGVVPVTNAVNLLLRTSNAGIFQTANYIHRQWRWTGGGSGVSGSSSDSHITITSTNDTQSNASTTGLTAIINIGNMLRSGFNKGITWQATYLGSDHLGISGAAYTSSTNFNDPVDGFRLLYGSGNISKGTFTLYGLRNS